QAIAAEAAARAAAASAQGGLAVARAALAQTAAARDIARLNVERTRIAAPVDGLVVARSAALGALSSAAGDPMFTLIENGMIEMQGEVIETALLDLQRGDRAELDVAGVGRIAGEVRLLPAAVDPATRLGEVRIALPADDRLRAGLFASGDIVTSRRESVTVPATAVLADADGERVQVVANGIVDSRAVRAGLLWQGRREILEGVSEGEMVIERAGAFFRAGDPVNVVQAGQDATGSPALAAGQSGAAPAAEPSVRQGGARRTGHGAMTAAAAEAPQ
ncbi:MAG TPA: efflux RND transporter periplasmic adaptor subunit, partial [Paracoccus sp. (in: a-proteobacteria)]|nr:efflux RND transporter periplasmic adaptor subunit [Paracoccus sp. (in: a-proteobacteria)]